MADFVFNVAKGRIRELANRVLNSDPTNAGLTVVAINTSADDATLEDLDTLAAVLADGDTAEVTNSGYERFDITDSVGGLAIDPDDANDWVDIDIDNITFPAVQSGDAWTDIVICYNPDVTSDVDANMVPLCQYDYPSTPDGSDIVVQIHAEGFFRSE